MIAVAEPLINGIDVSSYKEHPRMLELRLILLFSIVATEYGHNKAVTIFQKLSEIFRTDFAKLQTVINSMPSIQQMRRTDKWRYRQEVIFLGHLYNETRGTVATKYLQVHYTTIYRMPEVHRLDNFVTQRWLDQLDDSVVICGVEAYRLEVLRFLEDFEFFLEVMGNVHLSTKDIRSLRYDHRLN